MPRKRNPNPTPRPKRSKRAVTASPPPGITIAKDGTWRDRLGQWVGGTPSPNAKGRGTREEEVERQRAVQTIIDPPFVLEFIAFYVERWRKEHGDADAALLRTLLPHMPTNLDVSLSRTGGTLDDLTDDEIRELFDAKQADDAADDSRPA